MTMMEEGISYLKLVRVTINIIPATRISWMGFMRTVITQK